MGMRVFDLFKDGELQNEEEGNAFAVVPYPFETMGDLLQHGKSNGLRIAAMMRANERVHESEDGLNARLDRVWLSLRRSTAGAIPAVLRYYEVGCRPANAAAGVRDFLLTAAALGAIASRNGLLAAGEVVLDSESAIVCAMAAAGLSAALGGSNEQVEAAAVIGLGLCSGPDGERTRIGGIDAKELLAAQAIAAASAVLDSGSAHRKSFDGIIADQRRSGAEMQDAYRNSASATPARHRVALKHAAR